MRWDGATYTSSECVLECETSGVSDEHGTSFIGEL
jgi:hypothetical protein